MTFSYFVRPVTLEDTDDLHRLCWPDAIRFDVETRLIDVLARHEKQRAWGIATEVAGQAVAYGQLTKLGKRSEISDLVVHEPLRGRGIGSALITHLVKLACTHHLSVVEIGAALSNPRALRLYQRLGFEECRRVKLDLGYGLEPVVYLRMEVTQPHG
jgi:ribosomal protein S18 acetylase RimI-like enzyme